MQLVFKAHVIEMGDNVLVDFRLSRVSVRSFVTTDCCQLPRCFLVAASSFIVIKQIFLPVNGRIADEASKLNSVVLINFMAHLMKFLFSTIFLHYI